MNGLELFAGVLAALLAVYLTVALLKPDVFS